MPLPESIPTVRVRAQYLTLEGNPRAGKVVFRAPALTFPDADVSVTGPVTEELDATGAISVTLPATDAPGMNPSGWAYQVTEQLAGVDTNRPTFAILLPAATPEVDLFDIAPTDPSTPNYIPVKGDPGVVQSVNGQSVADVVLDAEDVHAVPDTAPGTAGGVAQLDETGRVPAEQLPAASGGGVQSVNGDAGPDVVLDAVDVGALPAAEKGAASGVATLDGAGVLTAGQRPTYTAADVGALSTAARGTANGVAGLGSDARLPAAQAPTVGRILYKRKTGDTPRNTTITPAADPHLSVTVEAGAEYDVEVVGAWTNGGGGMRCTWSAPAGSSMTWTDNDGVGQTDIAGAVTFSGTTGTTLKGTLVAGAAGAFALSWAQSTSNAADTILRAGSSLKLTRVA